MTGEFSLNWAMVDINEEGDKREETSWGFHEGKDHPAS